MDSRRKVVDESSTTTSSSSEDSEEETMNQHQQRSTHLGPLTPLEKKLQRKVERLTKENVELKHMLFTRIPRLLTAVERSNYFSSQQTNSHGGSTSTHPIHEPHHNPNGNEMMNPTAHGGQHLSSSSFQEWDEFCSRYVRQSVPPNDEQVEIFPGSGVLVSRTAFYNAQQCCNSSSYVRALLQAAFPKSVLVRSNLRGGKSKTPVGMPQPPTTREKLDPVRLEAIYNAVFRGSPVSRGVNSASQSITTYAV